MDWPTASIGATTVAGVFAMLFKWLPNRAEPDVAASKDRHGEVMNILERQTEILERLAVASANHDRLHEKCVNIQEETRALTKAVWEETLRNSK